MMMVAGPIRFSSNREPHWSRDLWIYTTDTAMTSIITTRDWSSELENWRTDSNFLNGTLSRLGDIIAPVRDFNEKISQY